MINLEPDSTFVVNGCIEGSATINVTIPSTAEVNEVQIINGLSISCEFEGLNVVVNYPGQTICDNSLERYTFKFLYPPSLDLYLALNLL